MKISHALAVSLAFGVLTFSACGQDSPTSPTGAGITVYQDPEYRGNARTFPLEGNIVDLDDITGPCGSVVDGDWDDCISSIRVPAGWQVTVFENDQNGGASVTFTADVVDLERERGPCDGNWDDCISSMTIRRR